MHELSICRALVAQATAIAERECAAAVERVAVSVGPLSGVDAGLLRRAFPIAVAGTLLAQAKLQVTEAPVMIHCARCDRDAAAAPNQLRCPHCHGWRTELIGGHELVLTELDLRQCAEQNRLVI